VADPDRQLNVAVEELQLGYLLCQVITAWLPTYISPNAGGRVDFIACLMICTLYLFKMVINLIAYAAVAVGLAYLVLIFPRVCIIHQ
jgi:hypothetical protein